MDLVSVRDENGSLLYRVVAQQDISGRKQAEEALRESEEKMRSIFRAAPTGIGVVRDRVLLDVNSRICEMTGYAKEELVGKAQEYCIQPRKISTLSAGKNISKLPKKARDRWRRAG